MKPKEVLSDAFPEIKTFLFVERVEYIFLLYNSLCGLKKNFFSQSTFSHQRFPQWEKNNNLSLRVLYLWTDCFSTSKTSLRIKSQFRIYNILIHLQGGKLIFKWNFSIFGSCPSVSSQDLEIHDARGNQHFLILQFPQSSWCLLTREGSFLKLNTV